MPWWLWLSSMGVMLSCSVAVKFVGIFVVIFVGFRTIADLWEILGDISRPVVFFWDNYYNISCTAPYLIILY
jgi:dolichyl-phosphate-mannose-protein mannosyltransferase